MSPVEIVSGDGEEATDYVAKIVSNLGIGVEDALRTIGRKTGLGYSAVFGFYHGRRKTAGYRVIAKLRELYLTICQQQVDRYLNEIEIERSKGRADAALEDIEARIRAFAVEIREAKEKLAEK